MNLLHRVLVLLAFVASTLPSRAEPTADGLYAGFFTSQGTFWARLEFEKVPRTVANFVSLAEGSRTWIDFPTAGAARRPFYNGLTFHRVISGFMIQGGSPNGLGTDGPGYQFNDEFHATLRHFTNGILSMANSGVDSNGSQFFVTVTNTPWLDGLHSVFGQVVEGMDIVHALSKVPTGAQDRPVTPIILQEVRILRRGAAATAFDPNAVTPALPSVDAVPIALLHGPGTLNLALQPPPGTNRVLSAFISVGLPNWTLQRFAGGATNLNASTLLTFSNLFFRVISASSE